MRHATSLTKTRLAPEPNTAWRGPETVLPPAIIVFVIPSATWVSVPTLGAPTVARRTNRMGWIAATATLLCGAIAAIIAAAIVPPARSTDGYSVRVLLPVTDAPLPVPAPKRPADTAGAPPLTAVAPASLALAAVGLERQRPSEAVDLQDLPIVRNATLRAIESGVAQNFMVDDLSGSVVAGAPALVGRKLCRTVVLWTKGEGTLEGQASDERLCRASSGAWVRVPDGDLANARDATDAAEASAAPDDPLAD